MERKTSDEQKHVELLELLQNKVAKMHKEKLYYEMRDQENCHVIAELRYTVSALKNVVINSQIHSEHQLGSHKKALEEVGRLRKELRMKSAKLPSVDFKEFVTIKREATALKLENEQLKATLTQKTG